MQVTDLINLMVNNGFAIAVAAYLLIRLEKQIANLSSSIRHMKENKKAINMQNVYCL